MVPYYHNKKKSDYSSPVTQSWLADHGFNSNGDIWLLVDDPRSCRARLKPLGAKWVQPFGWTFDKEVTEVNTIKVNVDYVANMLPDKTYIVLNSMSTEKREVHNKQFGLNKSDYVGSIGDTFNDEVRVIGKTKKYDSCGFGSFFYIYNMEDEKGHYFYVLKKKPFDDINIGDSAKIQAKIADHKDFYGVKKTRLSDCTAIKI